MPTKAKKPTSPQPSTPGFFQRTGAKVDRFLAWLCARMRQIGDLYNRVNKKYSNFIHTHKISQVLPSSLVIMTLFVVMIPILVSQILHNDMPLYNPEGNIQTAIPETLVTGEISQEIYHDSAAQNITRIGVMIGTHARKNHAEYELLIKQNNEIIYSKTFSALHLKDNQYNYFDFTPIELAEDANYTFAIRVVNASENDAIAIYLDSETKDIVYQASSRSPFYGLVIIVSIVFTIAFLTINYLINSGKIKGELQYLACMLVYIIPVVFIYPINTIPDEFYHFGSAIRLAQYDWSEDFTYNTSSRHKIQLPTSGEYCLGGIHMPPTQEKISNCLKPDHDVVTMDRFQALPETRGILAYAPAALGVMFGDLISDSPWIIYYCGRVANLIVVGLILIFALLLVKKQYRMYFVAIIMIPMFLQQAGSYSYDGLLNSLCLLVVAYGIRFLTTDSKVRKKDLVIMALALVFIGLIKLPYIAVATPLLFVKKQQFGRFKMAKWIFLIGVFIMAATIYLIDQKVVAAGAEDITMNVRGLPLSSLLAHPRSSLKMILRTLWTQSGLYLTGMIGFFSWFYFSLNPIIVFSYLTFLVVIVLSRQIKVSKFMRILSFLAAIALSGSIFLAMYISYTTEGAPIIEGVQGRYFLPVLPLLMLAFTPEQKRVNLPDTTCYTFMNLTTLCFVITLLVGFY